MKKILHELNIMDIILCLFVIFIHASSEAVGLYRRDSIQFTAVFLLWKLCSMAVPCFIFLAGFRFFYSTAQKGKDKFDYVSYIRARLLNVYVPYVIWVIVYYMYFVRNDYFAFSMADLLLYILRGDLVAHFYFIIIIFQFYLLAPLWLKLFTKMIKPSYAVAASFLIMMALKSIGIRLGFAYNDYLFTTYLAYWTAGCFFGLRYENTAKKNPAAAIYVFAGVGSVHLILSLHSAKGMSYPFAEQLHMVYCLAGCYFMYYLCLSLYRAMVWSSPAKKTGKADKQLSPTNNLTPLIILSKLSGATFYVYLSHILVILFITNELSKSGVISVTLRFAARASTGLIIPFIFSILYIRFKAYMKPSSAYRRQ